MKKKKEEMEYKDINVKNVEKLSQILQIHCGVIQRRM